MNKQRKYPPTLASPIDSKRGTVPSCSLLARRDAQGAMAVEAEIKKKKQFERHEVQHFRLSSMLEDVTALVCYWLATASCRGKEPLTGHNYRIFWLPSGKCLHDGHIKPLPNLVTYLKPVCNFCLVHWIINNIKSASWNFIYMCLFIYLQTELAPGQ